MLRLMMLELRVLARSRAVTALIVLLLGCCALAYTSGQSQLSQQLAGRDTASADAALAQQGVLAQLDAGLAAEDAVLLPLRLRAPVIAPLPPLVDFSAGRSVFEAYAAEATLRTRSDNLFSRAQLLNPELALRGGFDLAFVVTVIAPLLLIALGYGLYTSDRDSGAARLVLVQGGTALRLFVARSAPRLMLVVLPVLATAALLGASDPGAAGRSAALLKWTLLAIALLVFWWMVIVLVNTLRVSAETAALSLVAVWALLTLILPPLISVLAQLAHPPPSRFEQIAAARAAEVAATEDYENDHPELAADDYARRLETLRKTIAVGRAVELALSPINERFTRQLRRQQALEQSFAWLSPPLVAANAMQAVAGSDIRYWSAFREAAQGYLDDFKLALRQQVAEGALLTPERYRQLPVFAWQPSAPPWVVAWLYLGTLAALLGSVAVFRLRK